jgi:hypothetical protein
MIDLYYPPNVHKVRMLFEEAGLDHSYSPLE